ncbi:transglycosylase SLT domain-containing protein [Pseudenhygromyxa sp. WMMC2535]|uniref:lytic transglycosylase domain-containing protein n=1 Tax=Pseudenhygromyxa sp. WMMC2535 TaxID=2712867 RepID=UPI001556AC13|nr:lytic transglycosylase domain-containing protein [Pseudenhygromyxa sp. WMMC2535]NVB39081.1 transglycosylase SLT domain-containing protein [Pseudenhygromyxa sp. WMMC2535]
MAPRARLFRPLLIVACSCVLVASAGCATSGAQRVGTSTASAPTSASRDTALEAFSEGERARILAVQEVVDGAAAEHGIDPSLLNAIIWVESRFNPKAKSPAGARGLMQLMPSTAAYLAKRMGERSARAYDPDFNVRAGALYLSEMIGKFGDEAYAVAAYHAGPGNVARWLEKGDDFPDYSQAYVAKVMDARSRFVGVDQHGRGSKARTLRAGAPSSSAASAVASEPAPAPDPEPLDVPDPASLPDAAEIHGVPRVVREDPRTSPTPAAASSTRGDEYEAVFEPHPELDMHPQQTREPSRERAPVRSRPATRDRPATQDRPATKDRPAPKKDEPAKDEPVGLGVLPDL